MPLLWSYLLSQYLKTFTLSVMAFIAILLTMRLDEIAYFATLGGEFSQVVWFTLQQIPYILPIAMPVAALISAMLLVQQLSKAHELTAMRACGFSFNGILAPILLAALFLSAANFYIISEISTSSHLSAGQFKSQLRAINPFHLLHNKHLMQVKGFYFDTLGSSRTGEFAQDVVFFSPNKQSHRLNLLVAKEIQTSTEQFSGDYVTLLTSQLPDSDQAFETLMVENMVHSKTPVEDFAQMFEKKIWTVNNDHLNMPLLLVRLDEAKEKVAKANPSEVKQAKEARNGIIIEIIRRVGVSLAVFSFTWLGLAFGISISRRQSNRGIFAVIILAAIYLMALFAGKNVVHALAVAACLYFMPHLIIWVASFWSLRRTARGIE